MESLIETKVGKGPDSTSSIEISEPSPLRMDIELTRNCGFKCGICSVRATLGIPEKEELTLDETKAIISDFASLSGHELVITGGEPLERGLDFVNNIIKHAKHYGLVVKLYTAGYRITNLSTAVALKLSGLDIAYVSLEGTPAEDELYKGVSGSFETATRAIGFLKAAGVEVIIHFTPISINFKGIETVVRTASRLGVSRVKIITFVAQGRGADNRDLYELTTDQKSEFGRILSDLMTRDGQVEIEFGGSPDYPPVASPSCSIGTRGFSITSAGEVRPCLGLRDDLPNDTFLLGDVRSNRLREIWLSPLMKELREGSHSCGLCQSLRRRRGS